MNGINFIIDKSGCYDALEFFSAVKSNLVNNLDIKNTYNKRNFFLCHVSAESEFCSHFFQNGVNVFVDGYLVDNIDSKISHAEFFYNSYILNQQTELKNFNGSFNIVIYDENQHKITFLSDRYGTRPLFIFESDKYLAISASAKNLIIANILKPELSLKQVANQLSYSRIWFGDTTFFKGLHAVGPATYMTFENNKLLYSKYWEWGSSKTENSKNAIYNCSEILKTVMFDFSSLKNVGLSLSGGLDSRVLLASGFKGRTFTWGYAADNDEIKIAKNVAKINGNAWDFICLEPQDFLDLDGAGSNLLEGLDIFVQSYSNKVYNKVKKSGITALMTGLALDFTMAGSYLPSFSDDACTIEKCTQFIIDKSLYFTPDETKSLVKSREIIDEINCLNIQLQGVLNPGGHLELLSQVEKFFLESRVRRYIFQRQSWQRSYVEDYIPTFDNRLIDVLLSIPLSVRNNHELFRAVLQSLSTDLFSEAYEGTLLPVSAPLEFWKQSKEIEARKEKMYRDIFFKSKGATILKYNRYYSNFDEWFRLEPSWKRHVRDMLLSDDTRLTQFLNMDTVKKWVLMNESGEANLFSKLIHLITLEKTLRTHFE